MLLPRNDFLSYYNKEPREIEPYLDWTELDLGHFCTRILLSIHFRTAGNCVQYEEMSFR